MGSTVPRSARRTLGLLLSAMLLLGAVAYLALGWAVRESSFVLLATIGSARYDRLFRAYEAAACTRRRDRRLGPRLLGRREAQRGGKGESGGKQSERGAVHRSEPLRNTPAPQTERNTQQSSAPARSLPPAAPSDCRRGEPPALRDGEIMLARGGRC